MEEIRAEEIESNMEGLLATQPNNLLIKNHFYLYEEISMESIKNSIANISELALTLAQTSLNTGMDICPIHLHLSSPGGDVVAAIAFIDFIKSLQCGEVASLGKFLIPIEVYTHIDGEADSAASLIACCGNKRFITSNSFSLIHSMKCMDGGFKTVTQQEETFDNNKKINEIYKRIYKEHSKISEEKLNEIFKSEKIYLPEELLEFGLVDEIEE